MAEKANPVEVPSDFEFLDPDRPDIGYEGDLTPEEREQMAPQWEKQKQLAASGKPLGPPWKVTLNDGTEVTFGGENGDKPDAA